MEPVEFRLMVVELSILSVPLMVRVWPAAISSVPPFSVKLLMVSSAPKLSVPPELKVMFAEFDIKSAAVKSNSPPLMVKEVDDKATPDVMVPPEMETGPVKVWEPYNAMVVVPEPAMVSPPSPDMLF